MSVSIPQSYEFPPVPPNKSQPPLSSPRKFPPQINAPQVPDISRCISVGITLTQNRRLLRGDHGRNNLRFCEKNLFPP